MPIRETLNASPTTLAEVLGNGKRYQVPMFQRDYAWEESEWRELWADIVALRASTESANHYLGALVLQPTGRGHVINIIDGQQRLVTLSLVALAVIVRIEQLASQGADPDDNRERARLLRERFVSTKDPASLQHHSRLRLNANDDGFYQTYLVQGLSPQRPNALKGSEARLFQAFEFFGSEVAALLGGADGAELARFLETDIASRLRFIEILVEDDETAFTVFETLNSRGVALGTADLLKNFLFATASKGGRSDLEQAQRWWDQILRVVPMHKIASLVSYKLAARVPTLREKRVFSEVKRLVPAELSPFDFLREVKEAAEVYAALGDPHDELWSDFGDARRHVAVLAMLRVEQVRSVVLAAFSTMSDRPDRISQLLRNLLVISVRSVVARVHPADLQAAYQLTAARIASGELKSPFAIARALASVTPSDDEFRNAFAVLAIDSRGQRKRFVRYLLASLEEAAGGNAIDFDASDANIEHILPENPGPGWEAFSQEDRVRDVSRLGNLTPLEHALNKALGASNFANKRDVYRDSRFRLTNGISTVEWTPEAIRARQAQLAEMAVRVWRIDE